MDRIKKISELQTYIEAVDKDMTMILQSLQWDRKHLLESPSLVACKYDPHHKILPEKRDEHEKECLLHSQGYNEESELLPDPPDPTAATLVKLNNEDINKIIEAAAQQNRLFKRGRGLPGSQVLLPCSLAHLQQAYSQDERRAIHDAVVSAAPATHDLADLALVNPSGSQQASQRQKTRAEILAELRDIRRRRPKYRVSGNTKNYSHALRDVIASQMEMLTPTHTIKVENGDRNISNKHSNVKQEPETYNDNNGTRYRRNDRYSDHTSQKRSPSKYGTRNSDKERLHYPQDRQNRSSRPYEGEHDTRHTHNDYDYARRRRYKDSKVYRDKSHSVSKDINEEEYSRRESQSRQYDNSHQRDCTDNGDSKRRSKDSEIYSKDSERHCKDYRESERHSKDYRDSERHSKDYRDSERHPKDYRDSVRHSKDYRDSERHSKDYRDSERHSKDYRDSERHSKDNYRQPSSSKHRDEKHAKRSYSETSEKQHTRYYDLVKVKKEFNDDEY